MLLIFWNVVAGAWAGSRRAASRIWVPGSAPVEAVTVAAAIGYYVLGGRGSDLGAIVGHQTDERQASIRIRARALAAQVAGLAAVTGYVIELARRGVVWPFELFAVVLAGSFLAGLVIYRTGGAGSANGPDGEHEQRSQVLR